jgi:transposase
VRVPTPEEEDAKRPHREREHLVQERLRIENRIEALLFTQGIRKRPSLRSWVRDLAELRTGDGRELPCLLRIELERLRRRLVLALELIHEVEAERAEALAATADDKMTQKIAALQRLRDFRSTAWFSTRATSMSTTWPRPNGVSLDLPRLRGGCVARRYTAV